MIIEETTLRPARLANSALPAINHDAGCDKSSSSSTRMNPIHPLLRADRNLGVKRVLTHDSAKAAAHLWFNTGIGYRRASSLVNIAP